MTRLLVLQPDADDPPARLGEWLTAAGAVLDVVKPYEDPVPDTLDGYQGVVCLGGAMGALDDAVHPWLADVRKLLSHAVSKNVPLLAGGLELRTRGREPVTLGVLHQFLPSEGDAWTFTLNALNRFLEYDPGYVSPTKEATKRVLGWR